MIACHSRAEIMAFVMIQLQAIHVNAHLVILDFHAKQTLMIANHHHAIAEHASMVITHFHANAIPDTLENCVKHRSMNANQVSYFQL